MSVLERWPELIAPLLDALGIDRFDSPERLPWLCAMLIACLWLRARGSAPALHWPGASQLAPACWHDGRLTDALALGARGVALACIALALCAPIAFRELAPEAGPGLDVMLVLDASGSMGALDTNRSEIKGSTQQAPTRRIDLARKVVGRFASGRIQEGDRIGLIVFGEHAFTQCPLTHDGRLLAAALDRIDVGVAGDATALGDALALAVRRVERADGEAGQAVVLLTDGRDNSGNIPVSIAVALARSAGVRVHAVAIGSDALEVPLAARLESRTGRHRPDRAALARIARETGGTFFVATSEPDLARVYAAIDALERSPHPRPARRLERGQSRDLLAAACVLLGLEIGALRGLRRRIPA